MLPTATTTTQPAATPIPHAAHRPGGWRLRRLPPGCRCSRARLHRRSPLVFAVVGAFGVNQRANAINDVRTASRPTAGAARHPGAHRPRRRHRQLVVPAQRAGGPGTAHRLSRRDRQGRRRAGRGLRARRTQPISSNSVQASRLLGSYVGLVEQARANNRQGFPGGRDVSAPGQRDRQQRRSRHARHRLVACGRSRHRSATRSTTAWQAPTAPGSG